MVWGRVDSLDISKGEALEKILRDFLSWLSGLGGTEVTVGGLLWLSLCNWFFNVGFSFDLSLFFGEVFLGSGTLLGLLLLGESSLYYGCALLVNTIDYNLRIERRQYC